MSIDRIEKLSAQIQEKGIEAVAINAGHDLKYFTGLDFHLSERPAILIVSSEKKCAFVFPDFENEKVSQATIPLIPFPYQEDTQVWPKTVQKALESLNIDKAELAVSPTSMRFLETDLLQSASKDIHIISGEDIFREIYIQKDDKEISAMRKAIEIAQDALLKTLPDIEIGKTEKEIANLLVINLLNAGSEPDLPFNPIVASGPNSANPHAIPSDRKLHAGDLLIIDWGARFNGYISDITRTFALGHIPQNFEKLGEIVLAANQAGRNKAAPGIQASQVDNAARTIIQEAGYGDFFLHRTGHGIGLNAHEDPYITQNSRTVLKEGMTFTVEPGIYLGGLGGIRIEDNVLITVDGAETLTSLQRDIRII